MVSNHPYNSPPPLSVGDMVEAYDGHVGRIVAKVDGRFVVACDDGVERPYIPARVWSRPTEEEIRRQCEAIREAWSEARRKASEGCYRTEPYEVPEVRGVADSQSSKKKLMS